MTKRNFNCDDLVVAYFRTVRTMKERVMAVIASEPECRIDDDASISCSHWGLFPLRQRTRGEA